MFIHCRLTTAASLLQDASLQQPEELLKMESRAMLPRTAPHRTALSNGPALSLTNKRLHLAE